MRIFLRTTASLVAVTLLAAAVFGVVAWRALETHVYETRQLRFADLASEVAALDAPSILDVDGELDPRRAAESVIWLEAASAGVRFYVLDLRGRIVAPARADAASSSVSMAPLRRFMDARRLGAATEAVYGDDPIAPGRPALFSAAILPSRGEPAGYLYGVFEDPMAHPATAELRSDLKQQLGLWALGGAALLGLVFTGLFHVTARQPVHQLATSLDQRLGERGFERPPAADDDDDPVTAVQAHLTTLFEHLDSQDKDIEGLARVRREVLANFTHDLRTPIATVRGYLETLALSDGALSPAQRQEYLEIALRHSERLSRLVDELLELSRLDRCEVAPRLERFRLAELIQDNIQRFRMRAEEAAVNLRAEFDPDMPPVFADVALMERALENLIGNADRRGAGVPS
ncbi:MAG: histidine kinase dimerization/phospho-acceptor domain-containing protein, partial [Acidobacteriota bacterium]